MKRSFIKTQIYILIIFIPAIVMASILDTPMASFSAAQEAWLLGNIEQAITLYQDQLDDPSLPEVTNFNLAFLYFFNNDYRAAKKYVDASLQLNPRYGPSLMLMGRLAYHQGAFEVCQEKLKLALKYHRYKELPAYYLGLYLSKQNKNEAAEKYFKQALDENSKFTYPYPLLANIYLEQQKYQEAIELLNRGLVSSYEAEIILKLAQAHELAGNMDEAKKYYGMFSYFFPGHPRIHQVKNWLRKQQVKQIYTHGFEPIPDRSGGENHFMSTGEKYMYNVQWGPIKVGELFTSIPDTLSFRGQDVYKVIFSLDSNPALAFIASLHSDYITYIDINTKQALFHFLHTRENNKIWDKIYDFDRDKGQFVCRTVHEDGHLDYLEKTLPINTIDGTSILFYARQLVKEKRSERVMTIIDENFVISDINFTGEKERVTVRGDKELTYLITGENHYKGIVGFTGKFRGWFRREPPYLPVKSDFEIWVGRITNAMASKEEQRQHSYAQ